jgi:hypothetical protein
MRYYQLFKNKPTVNDQQVNNLSEMDIIHNGSTVSEAAKSNKNINASKVHNFIKNYNGANFSLTDQDIDKEFYPTMMHIVPVGKFIGISKFDTMAKLVNIQNDDYVFQSGDMVETFSATTNDSDNLLQFRVVFNNMHDYSKFMTLLILTFADWKITEKRL